MLELLIDTDPGVDDALAILMAHSQSRVLGLSVSAGNVGLAHTVGNTLKLLDLIGAATPVFAGCPGPLLACAADAGFVHGADGFGDTGYLPSLRPADNEHAAAAIVRLAREHDGRLTLVALAPLTNLALALRIDPALPSRVARLVVMGGATTGRGNTPPPRAGRVQHRFRSGGRAHGVLRVAAIRSGRLGDLSASRSAFRSL